VSALPPHSSPSTETTGAVTDDETGTTQSLDAFVEQGVLRSVMEQKLLLRVCGHWRAA